MQEQLNSILQVDIPRLVHLLEEKLHLPHYEVKVKLDEAISDTSEWKGYVEIGEYIVYPDSLPVNTLGSNKLRLCWVVDMSVTIQGGRDTPDETDYVTVTDMIENPYSQQTYHHAVYAIIMHRIQGIIEHEFMNDAEPEYEDIPDELP